MSVTASPGADRRALHMTSTAQVSSDKQRLRIAATSIATVVGSTGPAHADNLAGGIAEVMACFLTQYVVRDVTVYTMLCCMHALLRCKPLLVKKKNERRSYLIRQCFRYFRSYVKRETSTMLPLFRTRSYEDV